MLCEKNYFHYYIIIRSIIIFFSFQIFFHFTPEDHYRMSSFNWLWNKRDFVNDTLWRYMMSYWPVKSSLTVDEKKKTFVDIVDQDQTVQNVQSDLWCTVHCFTLGYNETVSSSWNRSVILANEKNTIYSFGSEKIKQMSYQISQSLPKGGLMHLRKVMIDPCQRVHSAQADMGQNFSLTWKSSVHHRTILLNQCMGESSQD